jgi:uncharacterized protein YggU (UPF0235/DUF167 family)
LEERSSRRPASQGPIQAPLIDGKAKKALTVFLAKEPTFPQLQLTLKKGRRAH